MSSAVPRLSAAARRRSMRLAYVNGGLWAVGNGLASTTLMFYLVFDMGAEGCDLRGAAFSRDFDERFPLF